MKFLVPNYSCLQNPWLRGYRPQIPVLSVLSPQLNLLKPPRKKILGTPLVHCHVINGHTCYSVSIRLLMLHTNPLHQNVPTFLPERLHRICKSSTVTMQISLKNHMFPYYTLSAIPKRSIFVISDICFLMHLLKIGIFCFCWGLLLLFFVFFFFLK